MNLQEPIFAIYDTKAEIYVQFFPAINRAVAIRLFTERTLQPGNEINRHPEDYYLFEVATWNRLTCEFENLTNTALGSGLEYKSAAENQE